VGRINFYKLVLKSNKIEIVPTNFVLNIFVIAIASAYEQGLKRGGQNLQRQQIGTIAPLSKNYFQIFISLPFLP